MLSPRYPASSPSDAALSCPYIPEQKEQKCMGFSSANRASYITQEWQSHPDEVSDLYSTTLLDVCFTLRHVSENK